MSVVSVLVLVGLRASVMCDLDAVLTIVTNVNIQISSQMSPIRIAEPSSEKQTSCLSHIPNMSSLHSDDILTATLCIFGKEFTLIFFTQVLQDSNESFSLESNFPCLVV